MLHKAKEFAKKFIPNFLISWYHLALSFLGALLYGFPSRKMIVIGITGTNGKSTTIDLTAKILEEAGYKTASLSSIKFKIDKKEKPNLLKMTMPGRFKLQKLLREAANSRCKYAVLEITSEGVKQHRHRFIKFNTALLTNLTPEHIEAHKGFENYKKAKLELFKRTKKTHIVNLDDKNAEHFLKLPSERKFIYKIDRGPSSVSDRGRASDSLNLRKITAKNIQHYKDGVIFEIQDTKFTLNLIGDFNIYNALAAICIGLSKGIDLAVCKKALEKARGIPGRMEKVISQPFEVFVDYAFTPNALEQVYKTLKPETSKMICVLGSCGGGRDKWKRPVLGQIAAKYCDEIIITNEDPYDENPLKIMEDIEGGFSKNPKSKIQNPKYMKILDRRKAIRKALSLAEPNNRIIITGKGSEPWLCIASGKKIPWDDCEIVRQEFKNKSRAV